jgi:DNA polymerase-3 subunit beta
MNIQINKLDLLSVLQQAINVVERRQTLPILSYFLFQVSENKISISGTDMELEITATIPLETNQCGSFTVPARKFFDIVKYLGDDSLVQIKQEDENIVVQSGRSEFRLLSLAAETYPIISPSISLQTLNIEAKTFKGLISKTAFCMANQDVRYYLNGMLLEKSEADFKVVCTDGHRLAIDVLSMETQTGVNNFQIIVPRKTVLEVNRLLAGKEDMVGLEITANHIRFFFENLNLTSKLIDGRFPDYERVIPKDLSKSIRLKREEILSSLLRISVLSNEKYKGVKFSFKDGQLLLSSHNPEQERAEEIITLDYTYPEISIGFNVSYLIEILQNVSSDEIVIEFEDDNSSIVIYADSDESCRYVVMPMRL